MFTFFKLDDDDMRNIKKLQSSKIKSRRVIGRGTLISDAAEIRKTRSFQENLKRATALIT